MSVKQNPKLSFQLAPVMVVYSRVTSLVRFNRNSVVCWECNINSTQITIILEIKKLLVMSSEKKTTASTSEKPVIE